LRHTTALATRARYYRINAIRTTVMIHFNNTRPANAPAATLFEVITDYRSDLISEQALDQVQPELQGGEATASRSMRRYSRPCAAATKQAAAAPRRASRRSSR
jgi:hypothetical protein